MKDKKITKYLIFGLVGLVGLLIITRGITFAKYVSNAVLNYYLTSKGFYFDSEDLSPIEKKNIDTSWDGESVYFTLKNSANNTLATEYDIKYTVTCTVLDEDNETKKCYLNGTELSEMNATLSTNTGCKNKTNDGVDVTSYDESKCNEENYTWESIPSLAQMSFEVVDTNGNDVDTATVQITATATAPYKKELSATYTLIKDKSEVGALSVNIEKKNTHENIIVTNSYNEDKCVKLSWNANSVIIDLDDDYETNTDQNDYINEIIFTLAKKDSKNFTFYKVSKDEELKGTDFSVVESNECKESLQ